MAVKNKRSDAGNSDMSKRSHEVLVLGEKVKLLDLLRKEKKSYAEVAKIYGKNKSSILEIMSKERETHATFAVPLQTARVMARLHDKCLS